MSAMNPEKKTEYLKSAYCPENSEELEYSEFLKLRVEILTERALELMA